MSSKVVDSFKAKGHVKILVIDKETGKVVDTIENHNLIVRTGRGMLINLLMDEVESYKITKMAIGKGGADLINSPYIPIPPADGNSGLTTEMSRVNLASAVANINATNPEVTFTALFDCAVVNSRVNEVGLFFSNGIMFARYTFGTVSLESGSGFSLQVSWTIEF